MKNKFLLLGIILMGLAVFIMLWNNANKPASHHHEMTEAENVTPSPARIPAYQAEVKAQNLAPTLSPDEFFGKAREGYQAAKSIPELLAQLPCYCHCDQSLGHKSLHTCFETDHASHCVVCLDEALLAYKLQKEQRLSPEQIRQAIIAKYSAAENL